MSVFNTVSRGCRFRNEQHSTRSSRILLNLAAGEEGKVGHLLSTRELHTQTKKKKVNDEVAS